jgi:hypothetical protein
MQKSDCRGGEFDDAVGCFGAFRPWDIEEDLPDGAGTVHGVGVGIDDIAGGFVDCGAIDGECPVKVVPVVGRLTAGGVIEEDRGNLPCGVGDATPKSEYWS